MILHEALKTIHTKKQNALLFEVDFEKAYDKIKWPFVYKMLKLKNFPDKWCDWVMETMRGGHVGIKVNDEIGPYFKTFKGLRQGDAMSPLLFDIAADALAFIMSNALKHDLVKGVLNSDRGKGINMLQYADDTIFLIKDEIESVKNLKLILGAFEQMSGLKINFHKSDLLLFVKAREKQMIYQEILTCKMGDLPIKYLGMPVSENRIRNSQWDCVTDKIEKRCGCWQGKLLGSIAGRITLVQACLTNIPLFMMSFYVVPKGIIKKADFFRSRMVWQEDENVKKYHLVNWKDCCLPKDMSGLGILNLEIMNIALLAKWFWKMENEKGLRQDILDEKYRNGGLFGSSEQEAWGLPILGQLAKN